jgi:hypothetical protein
MYVSAFSDVRNELTCRLVDHLPLHPRSHQHLGRRRRRRCLPAEQPYNVALALGVRSVPLVLSRSLVGRALTDTAIFIILTPILATPIILVLWRGTRAPRTHRNEIRAARRGERFSLGRFKQGARAMFWQVSSTVLCILQGIVLMSSSTSSVLSSLSLASVSFEPSQIAMGHS